MTVADVADALNLSPEMIYKLIRQRDLSAIQIGSSWRINRVEFDAWLSMKRMASRKVKLQEYHHKIMKLFQRALKKLYGKKLRGVYVFGSVARGEGGPESDLDLLIVLSHIDDRWKERKKVSALAYELTFGKGIPIVVSIIVASEQELVSSHEPLFARIREEGKVAA